MALKLIITDRDETLTAERPVSGVVVITTTGPVALPPDEAEALREFLGL